MPTTRAQPGTAASQTVHSRDGTTISYRTVGQGPAVIVIPGVMSTAERKYLDAFAEFSIAAGPRRAQKTPSWMMKLILLLIMRATRRQKLYRLLPANLLEHQKVARLDNTYHNYREVLAPTLLMFGGRSGFTWVAPAIKRLSEVLPASELRGFPKLDHFGPDQKGPREVAEAVKQYFLQ
jgi:hypothetical protein